MTIQPNGQWELHKKPDPTKKNGVASASDDDEDLVEVTKSGESVRMGVPRAYGTPIQGQPSQYREQSSSSVATSAPRGTMTTNGKRPISAVIDLTSSGDEDEPLDRAPKRQFSGFNPNAPPYRPATGADSYRG